jgi:hypothetical protein
MKYEEVRRMVELSGKWKEERQENKPANPFVEFLKPHELFNRTNRIYILFESLLEQNVSKIFVTQKLKSLDLKSTLLFCCARKCPLSQDLLLKAPLEKTKTE